GCRLVLNDAVAVGDGVGMRVGQRLEGRRVVLLAVIRAGAVIGALSLRRGQKGGAQPEVRICVGSRTIGLGASQGVDVSAVTAVTAVPAVRLLPVALRRCGLVGIAVLVTIGHV